MSLKQIYLIFKREIKVYKLVLKDNRTPRLGKLFLSLAVGYFFMPFDLIPDFIPILGHLDDLIVIPLLIFIAIKLIPQNIIDDCRKKVT